MSEVRKYRKFRQREPLRVPQSWNGEDRAFAIQLNGQLDDVYARLGNSQKTEDELESSVSTLETSVTTLEENQYRSYYLGSSVATMSSLETALNDLNATLSNYDVASISWTCASTTESPMAGSASYGGIAFRSSSTRMRVLAMRSGYDEILNIYLGSNGWVWGTIKLSRDNSAYVFNTTQDITVQADNFPTYSAALGYIASYGHKDETGVPDNSSYYVTIRKFSSTYIRLELYNASERNKIYVKIKSNGTWDSSWSTYTLT